MDRALSLISSVSVNSSSTKARRTACNCLGSLAAGKSCSISVTFTPSAAAQTGTLTITDNANGGMQKVPLSGTGK